ncbi:27372_t:CDS:2, partial [Racocetra persica]
TEQRCEEFNPPINTPLDLKPTKACLHAVECLSSHAKLVIGCSEKNTLDVFFQEIGIRFFGESGRFKGVFRPEEVYEFCQKREDWLAVKHEVEKELYGLKPEDCVL